MRSPKMKNNGRSLANGTRKNFFGNSPQTGFFSAPNVVAQLQPAPKLPEFSVDHFVNGNFAFFDADYAVKGPLPDTGTLFISHGVHMNYPATMDKSERSTFETNFVKSVHDTWSHKHMLGLAETGFAPYLCDVDVSAHVEDDPKDAHTVIDVVKPKPSAKRFRSRVSEVEKKQGSETTHKAKMDFRDPTTEKDTKINEADLIQQVGNFDFDSDVINTDCKEDIEKVKTFIRGIPGFDKADPCAFSLHYVGRASSQGSAAYNKKLSEKRVRAVQKELEIFDGLCLSIEEDAGEEEATESADFRRVNVGVFISNPNKPTATTQNVAAHEFGHMIGLGDEYIDVKPDIPNARKKFFGDNPTHYDLVKEVVDEEAANELLIENSRSIMSVGNEVKRGHYAFFVAALDVMTRPEIEKATGKKDARWIVF
jgi:outer membrane protein OmpA-like peptidoglycan-associated protein